MAYLAPTAADLKVKFPAFAAVADEVIIGALDEAVSMVDDRWVSQADFSAGRMLYAAHIMTLDGHGTGAEAQAALAGTLGYTTIKSADLTLTREGGGASRSTLLVTQYGTRFYDLLRRNVPAVVVV